MLILLLEFRQIFFLILLKMLQLLHIGAANGDLTQPETVSRYLGSRYFAPGFVLVLGFFQVHIPPGSFQTDLNSSIINGPLSALLHVCSRVQDENNN